MISTAWGRLDSGQKQKRERCESTIAVRPSACKLSNMKRWRPRILWIFAALVVACCIYLWSLSPQVAAVQLSRKIARQSPYVHMVPLALPDSSVATAAGTRLTYCGYVFEVPWNDLDEAKTTSPDRVVLHFRSGRTLILHSLPPREFVNGIGH